MPHRIVQQRSRRIDQGRSWVGALAVVASRTWGFGAGDAWLEQGAHAATPGAGGRGAAPRTPGSRRCRARRAFANRNVASALSCVATVCWGGWWGRGEWPLGGAHWVRWWGTRERPWLPLHCVRPRHVRRRSFEHLCGIDVAQSIFVWLCFGSGLAPPPFARLSTSESRLRVRKPTWLPGRTAQSVVRGCVESFCLCHRKSPLHIWRKPDLFSHGAACPVIRRRRRAL